MANVAAIPRPIAVGERTTTRLELSREICVPAAIDRKRFKLERLEASERNRGYQTLRIAAWEDNTNLLAPVIGAPLIPGMAGRIFKLLGRNPHFGPHRGALLQLAPGFIQITAAMMDEMLDTHPAACPDHDLGELTSPSIKTGSAPEKTDSVPAVASLGGSLNSR